MRVVVTSHKPNSLTSAMTAAFFQAVRDIMISSAWLVIRKNVRFTISRSLSQQLQLS